MVAIFFVRSLRYCVNIDHRVATVEFVAIIFNIELMVVIFVVRCDMFAIQGCDFNF